MSLQISIVGPADVPVLVALPGPGEGGSASLDRMSRYLAGEHHPQQALDPRVMYMASEFDQPVGYIAGHLTRRYDCDGELQWIYVRRDRRGSGVAHQLLIALATWFVEQGARRICVDVGADSGRRFYEKHGAQVLNRHWMVWGNIGSVIESTQDGCS